MILPIVLWPDPSLRRVSEPVQDVHAPVFKQLVADMYETMYVNGGVGLSAIQVGTTWRVFVMDAGRSGLVAFINPRLVDVSGDQASVREGCLSVPDVYEKVDRFQAVVVEFTNPAGLVETSRFVGVEAQCVLHELEHLDGKLFVDKLSPFKRERILKKMKEKR